MIELGEEEFEELVADALDSVPPELTAMMRNVVVVVVDRSPDDPHLLGLYEGIPLTERGAGYSSVLPDRITLFRGPILRRVQTREQAVREVTVTVVHEIAHHFGIDDDRLTELGWD